MSDIKVKLHKYDAVNKQYDTLHPETEIDQVVGLSDKLSGYVKKAGDTMTGDLTLEGYSINGGNANNDQIQFFGNDNGGDLGTTGANINIKSWYGVGFINGMNSASDYGKVTVGINVRDGSVKASKYYGALMPVSGASAIRKTAGTFAFDSNSGGTVGTDAPSAVGTNDWTAVQFGMGSGNDRSQFVFDGGQVYERYNDNELTDSGWSSWVKLWDENGIMSKAYSDQNGANIASTYVKNSAFTQSKATNGWTKLPNGVILQWGTVSNSNATQVKSVTFPTAFPNAVVSIQATNFTGGQPGKTGSSSWGNVGNVSKKGFQLSLDNYSGYWMAIGW